MPDFVADTHALIWHLTGDKRLSSAVHAAFQEAEEGRGTIWIPGIVLVEAVYLVEKARYPITLITQMLDLVDPPSENYALVPLDAGLIRALQAIDRTSVPELPDRIVAASALYLELPLLSKDSAFSKIPGLSVVW